MNWSIKIPYLVGEQIRPLKNH